MNNIFDSLVGTSCLHNAQEYAKTGHFREMLELCRGIINDYGNDFTILLDVGALLSSYGFLSEANECYERVCSLAPNDLRAVVNIANLACNAGDHAQSR